MVWYGWTEKYEHYSSSVSGRATRLAALSPPAWPLYSFWPVGLDAALQLEGRESISSGRRECQLPQSGSDSIANWIGPSPAAMGIGARHAI